MGKYRGKRNAAREKVWPGDRADQLRSAKREANAYLDNGIVNWKMVAKAADALLPDMPLIEYGDKIASEVVVNLSKSRRFKTPEPSFSALIRRMDSAKAKISAQVERVQRRLDHAYATPKELSDSPIVNKAIKHVTPGNACDRCGGPRGGPPSGMALFKTPHYCAACYRLNAIDRRERLATDNKKKKQALEARVAGYRTELLERREDIFKQAFKTIKERDIALQEINDTIEAYNYWIEDFALCIKKEMPGWDGHNWDSPIAQQKMKEGTSTVLIRSCPDFSIALLDAIEEAEEFTGIPYAKWGQDKLSKWISPAGQRKQLYSGSLATMMPRRKSENRIRLNMKSKAVRGKLLKAA